VVPIFKCPVTDEGKAPKKSAKGIPVVYRTQEPGEDRPEFYMVETDNPAKLDKCAFRKVFCNSKLLVRDTFENIQKRVKEAA
jgi:hypothetical protein